MGAYPTRYGNLGAADGEIANLYRGGFVASMARRSFAKMWLFVQQSVTQLPLGGDWALSLSKVVHRDLRWFWFDGLFAAASDNIMVTYLAVYLLALGATRAQVGLMSSLSSLSAALLLLPGALLVERIGRRKPIVLYGGGGIARLMILLLALIPLVWDRPAVVWIAVALAVTREASANLAFPAWMAIAADIVPLEGRGRYFGSRNFVMGIAAMGTTLLVGQMITSTGGSMGYQLALLVAFALGVVSTFCFAHLSDPPTTILPAARASVSLPTLLRGLGETPGFLTLCGTAALWNFSLNVAGPFFNVYLVQNLHATATMVGITSVASSLTSLAFQRKWGELADRWGPRRVQTISMLTIPILPILWLFVNAPWQVIPINLLGGLLWGAFNLASFNFLLALTPESQRARYSALYQIVVTLALAAGAAVGSVIVTRVGYHAVFLGSGVGRIAAALLFARLVHAPKQ